MSDNERHGENNAVVENSAASMIRKSAMQCEQCKTFNIAVCCYQTPFDIASLLEQVSNYDVLLIEQIDMKKITRMK